MALMVDVDGRSEEEMVVSGPQEAAIVEKLPEGVRVSLRKVSSSGVGEPRNFERLVVHNCPKGIQSEVEERLAELGFKRTAVGMDYLHFER